VSLFLNRSKRAGRFLEWKVRIFAVGATLALGGMYLHQDWLVGVALVVLVGGMAVTFLPGGSGPAEGEDPADVEGPRQVGEEQHEGDHPELTQRQDDQREHDHPEDDHPEI